MILFTLNAIVQSLSWWVNLTRASCWFKPNFVSLLLCKICQALCSLHTDRGTKRYEIILFRGGGGAFVQKTKVAKHKHHLVPTMFDHQMSQGVRTSLACQRVWWDKNLSKASRSSYVLTLNSFDAPVYCTLTLQLHHPDIHQ